MVNKAMRTKDKYAKAAAELDALEKCLNCMENAKALLPAHEIDELISFYYKVNYLRVLLENKAVSDFAGDIKFNEASIIDIFFQPIEFKNNFEEYKIRREQLRSLL